MKLYLKQNVLEAAQKRISDAFDDFDDVMVNVSGGKDSSVVHHLVMQEAKRRNRLPLKTFFLDQEAEWDSTINHIRKVMYHPDVKPCWHQVPFHLSNNSSTFDRYIYCWDPAIENEWVHPKDPISIKDIGSIELDNFYAAMDTCILRCMGQRGVVFAGVRADESPTRYKMVCNSVAYKGKNGTILVDKKDKEVYRFYPIYDWKTTDVWKYIYDNNIEYNPLYDYFYSVGFSTRAMRVSSVCHDCALSTLLKVAEIEPDTWARLTSRLSGANTCRVLKEDSMCCPDKLPYMFSSWVEYKDYLIDNLVEPQDREAMRKTCAKLDRYYGTEAELDAIKTQIKSVILVDVWGVKVDMFHATHSMILKKKEQQTKT
ncbi:MAG: phosphoadenosine phosphosulfate reductase family protein [Planctomycetaceae bacterium]|jgi:predicted phosphoadenosine phosphosulfate sulfurtransferase|nr:phosphoadenosine phosphosulfate reductase family protein [Planctomycetaceae bacterium]